MPVTYTSNIAFDEVKIGDTVTITGTINDPRFEFPDGVTELTWTHTFEEPDGCEPTVIEAPNGDLPVDGPCGPNNATWILPLGDDAPVGFTWKVAEDGMLSAVTNDGYFFDVPREEVFQKTVKYGYAPDTQEPCAPPPKEKAGFVRPAPAGPIADQAEVLDGALPNAGGPDVLSALLAMAFLGMGGFLTARTRRRA